MKVYWIPVGVKEGDAFLHVDMDAAILPEKVGDKECATIYCPVFPGGLTIEATSEELKTLFQAAALINADELGDEADSNL